MRTVMLTMVVAGCATTGPRLDATVTRAAATYEGPAEIEIRVDRSGGVKKLALTHAGAARVPEAVRKLFEEKLPGAKVKQYELELHDGVWFHEVEGETPDGRECEVSATEAGALRYVECSAKPEELPEAVRAAFARELPGAAIDEIETVRGPEIDQISIEAKVGGVVHAIAFKPTGEVIAHHLKIAAYVEVPRE